MSLRNYVEVLANARTWVLFRNSLVLATLTTIVAGGAPVSRWGSWLQRRISRWQGRLLWYYGPAQGRFTGVDPSNAGANPADPQTWNGYAYVNNNPLSLTDPSGEGLWSIFTGVIAGIGTAIACKYSSEW